MEGEREMSVKDGGGEREEYEGWRGREREECE